MPELQKAVKRSAEEGEGVLRHVLVFHRHVAADQGNLRGEPALEVQGRLNDVHLQRTLNVSEPSTAG